MSILKKPYEISVWDDVWDTEKGKFVERRLGIIGSDKMLSQSRAIEPQLTRNVNGTKKFSFKMYHYYIDNETGEKVENPFIGWLISERKVKLKYGTYIDENEETKDCWYDFIIKQVNENSSNYLYTYQLEDALVQELSKNGFNVTLDAELMNNVGNAKKLAEDTLVETDWEVESETFVQKVEENLVYLTFPTNFNGRVYHIKDQSAPYTSGVTVEEVQKVENPTFTGGEVILAFYSSCRNKPHRFQFIYIPGEDAYEKDADGELKIKVNASRIIEENDCQYYIDFTNPNIDYVEPGSQIEWTNADNETITQTNGAEEYGLFLPADFSVYNPGTDEESDTPLSSWYRGARYGYAQQAEYIPVLDRYCQKFERNEQFDFVQNENIFLHRGGTEESITWEYTKQTNGKLNIELYNKEHKYSGIQLKLPYYTKDQYLVKYKLKVTSGTLYTIGGHNHHYKPLYYIINDQTYKDDVSYITLAKPGEADEEFDVTIAYIRRESTDLDSNLYIQPNRGYDNLISCTINDLSVTFVGNYLGYTDANYVSPTLIQNCITGYNFESTGGWTATCEPSYARNSDSRATVENVYGVFEKKSDEEEVSFVNIIDDYLHGTYDEDKAYKSYMKMSFYNDHQFILNSGIRDNRNLIENMPKEEEWILDYEIVDTHEVKVEFEATLGEYEYATSSGGHNPIEGNINFKLVSSQFTNEETGEADSDSAMYRIVFKVQDTSYTKETFKKNSRIFVKLKPINAPSAAGTPDVYYIRKMRLYRKSLDENDNIIVPDYEVQDSEAAQGYVKNSVIENTYHYFEEYLVDENDAACITNADQLKTITTTELKYDTFIPVYNNGAEKVRSVTVKESNYFNILQNIAETFEAWLELKVSRNGDGAITGKIAKFKNFAGKENHANFRYGVNLKDIQRNFVSNNIVTKLIVKQNANELAKDGFCTIQRAGANPTGENYIYDFQYYQNKGIMDAGDYLNMVYHIDGAEGPDAELWKDSEGQNYGVTPSAAYTLNGYFPRVKMLNDALVPINTELIGLNTDLLEQNAEKKVLETTIQTATEGIQEVEEDFVNLTGFYPDEIQENDIAKVVFEERIEGEEGNSSKIEIIERAVGNNWWNVVSSWKNKDGEPEIAEAPWEKTIEIEAQPADRELSFNKPSNLGLKEYSRQEGSITGYKIIKDTPYSGLYIDFDYIDQKTYKLEYTFTPEDDSIKNIGSHNASFTTDFNISVTEVSSNTSFSSSSDKVTSNFKKGEAYKVTVTGTFSKVESDKTPYLFIQPNRGLNTGGSSYACTIQDIALYEVGGYPTESDQDRTAAFYLNVTIYVTNNDTPIYRTYKKTCVIPAGQTRGAVTQTFSPIDNTRSDVRNYIEQHATYLSKKNEATERLSELSPQITSKEEQIKQLEETRDKYLKYKRELNKLFFKKYSRFIQEGTWTSEEYVDDEKYYADALSVMYNSCYPQVSYTINTLALSALPGYEEFVFELGDKTNAIDEEFFGTQKQEEVIVSEKSENLDDPTKDQIKVQNFKNQFQDLFQKITATVQSAQYNEGSYKKGGALADASAEEKNSFLQEALSQATDLLSTRNNEVNLGDDGTGLTVTDTIDRTNQIRIVGGAILLSKKDEETGEVTWRTGLTADGISADLIKAGEIDTRKIQIMSGDSPTFKWDEYGISAYDAHWYDNGTVHTISGINKNKFIRFDKYGIYGINDLNTNGEQWHPTGDSNGALEEIGQKATFALTWKGLKVTGNDGVEANLGRDATHILKITKNDENLFSVTNDGQVSISSQLVIGDTENNIGSTIVSEMVYWLSNDGTKPNENDVRWNINYPDSPQMVWTKKIITRADGTTKTYIYLTNGPQGSQGPAGPVGPMGPQGNDGTSVKIMSSREECTAVGDGYIDENGHLQVRIGSGENDFKDAGLIQGPAGDSVQIETQFIYIRHNSSTNPPTKPQSWVENTYINTSNWTTVIPQYSEGYNYIWFAKQTRTTTNGTPVISTTEPTRNTDAERQRDMETWIAVTESNSTLIDGSKIYTGSVMSGQVRVTDGSEEIFFAGKVQDSNDKTKWNPFVRIAGWNVTKDSIKKGDLGNSGSIILSTAGITTEDASVGNSYFGQTDNKTWMLGIGEHFGVTSSGAVYASAGKIGAWNMGEVKSTENWSVGSTQYTYQNLLYGKYTKTTNKEHYLIYLRGDATGTSDLFVVRKKVPLNENGTVTIDGQGTVSNVFSISGEGSLTATKGKIAGWTMTANSLTKNTLGSTNGFHMYSSNYGTGALFGSSQSQSWALGIGANFGITSQGVIYCKNIQATGGSFGNISIKSGTLWDPTSATTGTTAETYLDTNTSDTSGVLISQKHLYSHKGNVNAGCFGDYVGALSTNSTTSRTILNVSGIYRYNGNYITSLTDYLLRYKNNNTVQAEIAFNDDIVFKSKTYGQVKLSDLVFKGPYDIKMGSTVIGKIGQLGPIVYGYIDSSKFSTYTDNTTLTIGGTISAPNSKMNVPIPYDSGSKTCVMEISTAGVFKLTKYWNTTSEMNDNGTVHGYFCYSVGSHALA